MFASKDLAFSRPSGYQISRSVRLRSGATAYFNRTPASATNQKTWTWSGWVKRGALGANMQLFGADSTTGGGSVPRSQLFITSSDQLDFSNNATGSAWVDLISTSVYRDSSAWYHVMCAIDTTQATAANRVKLYVNNSQITAFGTAGYPAQNDNTAVNTTGPHNIGRYQNNATQYFDGYITEVNFIDGQALTPSSFGQYNANGVWSPIKYAGTYGTNGFYLNFSDNSASTATTIGKDNSGNGNNWTPNNISVTAGVTYDSMLDVPTLYADGGNGRGNYAVLNPLENVNTTYMSFQNGNLRANMGTGAVTGCWSSMVFPSGKFYFETTITTVSNGTIVGISYGSNTYADGSSKCIGYTFNGDKSVLGTSTAYGATYTTGDVIGIAVDKAASTVTFYKNNASQGVITDASILAQSYRAWLQNGTSGQSSLLDINFGQRPFTYTPPTGFVAINTQNLSTPTIANGAAYMAATTYTGNDGTQSIVNTINGVSFQPDLVWVKARSNAFNHDLVDSVRGNDTILFSNLTNAETAVGTTGTQLQITSSGFTVIQRVSYQATNQSAVTYVGWQWKAGTTSSSNTSGTITSTVSVGATQGFSVVTYTGTGANATVGHGLGVAPSMMIIKNRGGVVNWGIYHKFLGSGSPQTYVLQFDTSAQFGPSATYWNSTAPTSSVFSLGTLANTNGSGGNFVAYCFSEVAGFSKFGSYTGNGSADGPFVYLGFRPRFILIKASSAVADWDIFDSSRDTSNTGQYYLFPNTSGAEHTLPRFDLLSNGIKLRTTGDPNNSSVTYIYAAFAENPFKYSLAR